MSPRVFKVNSFSCFQQQNKHLVSSGVAAISVLKRKVQTMAKASSLAQNLAKELECAVCLEQYKEPKVLPCLHSYCKKCLDGLLTKQGVVWRIKCPSCRISVEVSSSKCMFDL